MTVMDRPAVFAHPRVRQRARRRLTPREILPTHVWAERFRRVAAGPAVGRHGTPVLWDNSLDPLSVTVMRAMDSRRWSRVVVMGSPQRSGKTACAENFILSTIAQRRANVFYHNATAVAAGDVWKKKILPAIEKSPELAELLSGDREERGVKERRDFTNGASLFMRGSESRASLSQATAMITIGDDAQAMVRFPDGDHPADVAAERADSYPVALRRHILLGQPGMVDDYLSLALFGSTFYVPVLPCPGCGTFQMLEWTRFCYPSDPVAAASDTWMRCANPDCTHRIRDTELPGMLAEYLWVSTPPGANWVTDPPNDGVAVDLADAAVYPATDRQTTVCGFWRSALYWRFVDWGSLAVQAIEAEGNPDQAMNFQKRIRAVPHTEPKADEDALEPADIYAHATESHIWRTVPAAAGVHLGPNDKGGGHEPGKPGGPGVLIVTGDVMSGYLWYLAVAWNIATGSSWLIECGRLGKRVTTTEVPEAAERRQLAKTRVARGLDKLWAKCHEGWNVATPGGEVIGMVQPAHVLIDSRFLRDTVVTSCRRYNAGRWIGTWLPVEGSRSAGLTKTPIWPGLRNPRIDKKTKWRTWELNTNTAKYHLRDLLGIPAGEPGAFHLPGDMPTWLRETFAKHMCAEEWDATKKRWKQISGQNHLLDCMAEQLAGALCHKVALAIERARTGPVVKVTDYPARQEGKGGGWKIGR